MGRRRSAGAPSRGRSTETELCKCPATSRAGQVNHRSRVATPFNTARVCWNLEDCCGGSCSVVTKSRTLNLRIKNRAPLDPLVAGGGKWRFVE
jgi:hypothetical protein